MTKQSRTLLFLAILVLFALTAPLVILYAQGYRLDWKHGQIAKTGAMYIKTVPASADIALNGFQKERTSFFDGSVFIDNLLPGPYGISVSKKGYHPWKKTLQLLSQEVIEAKNIVLFPERVQFNKAAEGILATWNTPNNQELLVLQKSPQGGPELALINPAKQTSSILLSGIQPSRNLQDIAWSPSAKELLLTFQKKPRYLLLALKGSEVSECIEEPCALDFLDPAVQEIRFTNQPDIIAVLEQKQKNNTQLALFSILTKKRVALLDENTAAFTLSGNDVIWLKKDGTLKKQHISLSSPPVSLLEQPIEMRGGAAYSFAVLRGRLFLKEGSRLLGIHTETKKEEPVFSNVTREEASPDGKKIVLANDYEIFLYYLEDQGGQPERKAGDLIFVNRFSRKISNVTWLNANYLLYSLDNRVFVSEIDTRDSVNIVEIGQFVQPVLFWNGSDGSLAVLSEQTLYRADEIIK